MNVGVLLKGVLDGLVGGRVYASTFPQTDAAPVWPAIRFTVISREPFPDQCGSAAEETDDVAVQLDVVAEEYDALLTLRAMVIDAMRDCPAPVVRQLELGEDFDRDTRTHKAMLQYSFQFSSSEDSPS